jgi:hypothetical protein
MRDLATEALLSCPVQTFPQPLNAVPPCLTVVRLLRASLRHSLHLGLIHQVEAAQQTIGRLCYLQPQVTVSSIDSALELLSHLNRTPVPTQLS